MTTSLGGFSFEVSASTAQAQAALAQLVQQAQQAGQQVQAALAAQGAAQTITPRINTQQVQAGLQQIAAAQQQIAQRATVVTVRANLNEAEKSLDALVAHARALGDARINLTVNASEARTAEAAITRMGAALRSAQAGERINLNIRADNVEQADAALRKLTADINAAKTAGARVAVNVQTNAQQGGFLQQAAGGFIQQITPGLATGAAAAAGVIAAQAVEKLAGALGAATAAGIAYNAMLETSAIQFKVFIGSAEGADQALQRLRRNADITPFNTEEVIRSGAVFQQVANGSIERMEKLLDLAEQLAAVNPRKEQGGGLEGATIAIREALGGDFTSIERRFNVSRGDVQAIKDLNLAGVELAAALVKAAGGSKQLVDALGDTFEGRLSTAKSHLDELNAAATKPIFDVLAAGLKGFNDSYDQSAGRLKELVELLGRAAALRAGAGGLAAPLSPGAFGAALGAQVAERSQQGSPSPSAVEQAREQAARAVNAVLDEANKKLTEQKGHLADLKKAHEAIQAVVAFVTQEYEKQLIPLEAQERALNAQQRALDARKSALGDRRAAVGPPVEVRAAVAGAQAELDHDRDLLEIKHRRAELSESIARAEESAAERVAEKEITAQERVLQSLQQRLAAENQARAIVLEGLQEEIRKRQEARQAALEGLRAYIQAAQEERREALDAIREEVQARQEARRAAIDGLREEIQARRDAYDQEKESLQEIIAAEEERYQRGKRAAEEAHQAVQDRYRAEIEALQDRAQRLERQHRGETAAQRELAELNRAESARQRAQTLASAQTAVGRARTGAARRDAVERLAEIRAQQAADEKREALQARIEKEKEESDKKREAIADKIQEVERKARDEDRRFQREAQENDHRHREDTERNRIEQQQADHAEREQRRQEDAQVRAAEKADKAATKAENDQIRAQEKADKAQDRADQATLRAAEASARASDRADQEKLRVQQAADRAADRAAQQQILALQQQIAAARNTLSDRRDAFSDVLDAAALARLRETVDLENRQIAIRQQLAEATDPKALASVASAEVFLAEAQRILDGKKTLVEGAIQAIKDKEAAALDELKGTLAQVEIEIDLTKTAVDAAEKRVAKLKEFFDGLKNAAKSDNLDDPSSHGVQNPPSTDGGVASAAGAEAGNAWVDAFRSTIRFLWTGSDIEPVKAEFRQGGTDLGAEIGAGFAQQLIDDTAVKDAIDASTAAQQQQFRDLWGVRSPSTVMIDLATQVAQGFIDGLAGKQAELEAVERKPFEDQIDWLAGMPDQYRSKADETATAWQTAYAASMLDVTSRKPFEDLLVWMDGLPTQFQIRGLDAAGHWIGGFGGAPWESGAQAGMNALKTALNAIAPSFEGFGRAAASYFQNGFTASMNAYTPPSGTRSGGGSSSGGGGSTGSGGSGGSTGGGSTPAGGVAPTNGACPSQYNLFRNTQTGALMCFSAWSGSPGAPWVRVSIGTASLVDSGALRAAGSAIPSSLSAGASTASARSTVADSLTQNNSGNFTLTVNQTVQGQPGHDPSQIAQMSVAMLIDAIDKAERAAPPLVRRTLPGAIGNRV